MKTKGHHKSQVQSMEACTLYLKNNKNPYTAHNIHTLGREEENEPHVTVMLLNVLLETEEDNTIWFLFK